jgi:acetate kinase
VCHIGSGVSITAVKNDVSIDTTMGYAPGSGLLMGSRAGDLDTGALLALMQAQNLKPADAQVYLQTNGGLRGLAGEADLRLLLERRARGDKAAQDAISSFIYHIQKAIGSYVAIMGGLDTLIFTATASERSPSLRSLVVEKLSGLHIQINEEKNERCVSRDGMISEDDSAVAVLVIKTDEADEILRASETVR